MASRIPALPRDSHVHSPAAIHKNKLCDSRAALVARAIAGGWTRPAAAVHGRPKARHSTPKKADIRNDRFSPRMSVDTLIPQHQRTTSREVERRDGHRCLDQSKRLREPRAHDDRRTANGPEVGYRADCGCPRSASTRRFDASNMLAARKMGTAKFEPEKSDRTAKFTPITFPLASNTGPPDPP